MCQYNICMYYAQHFKLIRKRLCLVDFLLRTTTEMCRVNPFDRKTESYAKTHMT